jgi:hypothetical protein
MDNTSNAFNVNYSYVLLQINMAEYRKCQTAFSETLEVCSKEKFV